MKTKLAPRPGQIAVLAQEVAEYSFRLGGIAYRHGYSEAFDGLQAIMPKKPLTGGDEANSTLDTFADDELQQIRKELCWSADALRAARDDLRERLNNLSSAAKLHVSEFEVSEAKAAKQKELRQRRGPGPLYGRNGRKS